MLPATAQAGPARNGDARGVQQLHPDAASTALRASAAPWTPGTRSDGVASPQRRGAATALLEAAAAEAAARAVRLRARTDGVGVSPALPAAALRHAPPAARPAAQPPLQHASPPPRAAAAAHSARGSEAPPPGPRAGDPLDAAAFIAAACALRVAAQQARGQLDFFAAECEGARTLVALRATAAAFAACAELMTDLLPLSQRRARRSRRLTPRCALCRRCCRLRTSWRLPRWLQRRLLLLHQGCEPQRPPLQIASWRNGRFARV